MVMNEMNKGERIVREEKGSPGRSTETHEYLRNAQKMFLQIEMKGKITWWREASGKKGKWNAYFVNVLLKDILAIAS